PLQTRRLCSIQPRGFKSLDPKKPVAELTLYVEGANSSGCNSPIANVVRRFRQSILSRPGRTELGLNAPTSLERGSKCNLKSRPFSIKRETLANLCGGMAERDSRNPRLQTAACAKEQRRHRRRGNAIQKEALRKKQLESAAVPNCD